jgi:ABC-type glycerol-3-phosphate transport system substrate-binding protein
MIAEGYFLNLHEIEGLHLNEAWWDAVVAENTTIHDCTFTATSPMHMMPYDSAWILFFNQDMMEQNDMELPYQLVRDGKWTLDTFHEYVMSSSEDVDGSGDYTTDDLYGLICNAGAAASFLAGSNAHIIVVDDTGAVTINQSEHLFNALDQFFVKFMDKGNHAVVVAERKFGYDETDTIFPAGRGLFRLDMVDAINDMRKQMEDDFGVLPIPKYDEAQKSYYNLYNTAHATGYSIPITEEDPEMIGRILDLMGYYSEGTVYPARSAVEVARLPKDVLVEIETIAEL